MEACKSFNETFEPISFWQTDLRVLQIRTRAFMLIKTLNKVSDSWANHYCIQSSSWSRQGCYTTADPKRMGITQKDFGWSQLFLPMPKSISQVFIALHWSEVLSKFFKIWKVPNIVAFPVTLLIMLQKCCSRSYHVPQPQVPLHKQAILGRLAWGKVSLLYFSRYKLSALLYAEFC